MSLDRELQKTENWDAMVSRYAEIYEPLSKPYGIGTIDLLGDLQGNKVVEVAAGTGAVAMEAARRGADVVAVDSSPGMVQYLAARQGHSAIRLSVQQMDGQNLEFEGASFDRAYSVFGVFMFPDFRAGLAELRRVLKAGGRVAVTVWANPDHMEHFAVWRRAIESEYGHFEGFAQPEGWQAMQKSDGLAEELGQVGFSEIIVHEQCHAWRVPSATWLADHAYNVPFFESIYQNLGTDSKPRIRQRLIEQLIDLHGTGPIELPATAHTAIGRV
ncbi:MAG: class I SAM-dependent methyltransferase [Planctomycetota bacterium]